MSTQEDNMEPLWLEEKDWLVTIVMVDLEDPESRAWVAEYIGYLNGYALLTNTRMLALVGNAGSPVTYELLFSFDTLEHKRTFLELANSNEVTRSEPEEWLTPTLGEVKDASPLDRIIPEDMLREALLISVSILMSGEERSSA